VLKFQFRWMCRNVRGTLAFDFVGTGGAILWRSVVTVLASVLIVTIPWAFAWFTNWFLSQIVVVPEQARESY
jgi:hypothetical protein